MLPNLIDTEDFAQLSKLFAKSCQTISVLAEIIDQVKKENEALRAELEARKHA